MKDSFDLTTTEGLNQAAQVLKTSRALGALFNPVGALLDAGKKLIRENASSTSIENQSKAAVEIIKEVATTGAKRVRVTMDQQAGVNFSVPIEGAKVTADMGSKGKVTLDIEF